VLLPVCSDSEEDEVVRMTAFVSLIAAEPTTPGTILNSKPLFLMELACKVGKKVPMKTSLIITNVEAVMALKTLCIYIEPRLSHHRKKIHLSCFFPYML